MTTFNHMYDITFSLVSEKEDASDVTPSMLREAILERIILLTDAEALEAFGLCDTYEL